MRASLRAVVIVVSCATAVAGCELSVNEDINIAPDSQDGRGGATVNGNVVVGRGAVVGEGYFTTVNGSIHVEPRAQVEDCATVNGDLSIGEEARAGQLKTVNGSLEVGPGAQVEAVELVNGAVRLERGARVTGDVHTINGPISAYGATIEGDVSNRSGGMLITDASVVQGNLTVRQTQDVAPRDAPRIVIGPHSRVQGVLKFERTVQLYVHDTAEIGRVVGAEPIRFSGALPEAG